MHKNLELFLTMFKIGAVTIGGGYAMLPLIEHEVVERKKWVPAADMVDIFAVAQSLPGVIAINSAVCIGYRVNGIAGSLSAMLGVVLPSFLIISALALPLAHMRDNPRVARGLGGVRAAVTALVLMAAIRLGSAVLRTPAAGGAALLSCTAIVVFDVHPLAVIVAALGTGLACALMQRRRTT